ncbi:MAG: hypothetical protein JWP89_2250 [Schlesneria sp.]|nr:hypothetical protein [Schlesneria sp.]
MESDNQQIRMLSIAHYVVAGMMALSACIPLIHVTIGLLLFLHPPENGPGGEPFPAQFVGLIVAGAGTLMILFGWAMAICILLAGRSLEQRRRYRFCMVVAAIICLFPPLCTALGVLTLIVLSRPSVQTQFGQAGPLPESSDEIPFADADDRDATTS